MPELLVKILHEVPLPSACWMWRCKEAETTHDKESSKLVWHLQALYCRTKPSSDVSMSELLYSALCKH